MAVACGEGEGFTALVAERGDLWAFGKTDCGQLGLGTDAYQLQPVFVVGADKVFDGEAVVMVSAGTKHTACVTAKGTLWSWGNCQFGKLGHGDGESTQSHVRHPVRLGRERFGGWPALMVVAPHLLQGARVGRCHRLPPLHALAFSMGTHARLGSTDETAPAADATGVFDHSGRARVETCKACALWVEGRAGELEGVVRILGGVGG